MCDQWILYTCQHAINFLGDRIGVGFLFVYCYCPPRFSKRGGHSNSFIRPSVPLSVWHKNFKVHIFSSIHDKRFNIWHAWSSWQALLIGTMPWPWPSLLTCFKVKFVAARGSTILQICFSVFKLIYTSRKFNFLSVSVFQLENEKGRAPGRALCAKWAREGTF